MPFLLKILTITLVFNLGRTFFVQDSENDSEDISLNRQVIGNTLGGILWEERISQDWACMESIDLRTQWRSGRIFCVSSSSIRELFASRGVRELHCSRFQGCEERVSHRFLRPEWFDLRTWAPEGNKPRVALCGANAAVVVTLLRRGKVAWGPGS